MNVFASFCVLLLLCVMLSGCTTPTHFQVIRLENNHAILLDAKTGETWKHAPCQADASKGAAPSIEERTGCWERMRMQ